MRTSISFFVIAIVILVSACNTRVADIETYVLNEGSISAALETSRPSDNMTEARERLSELNSKGMIEENCSVCEMYPILNIALSEECEIIFSDSGAWVGMVESSGEPVQCIYGGTYLGGPYMQQGFGGDYIRYAQELLWALDEEYIPCAFVNIGTSDMLLVLLAEKNGAYSVLWYDELLSVIATEGKKEGAYFEAVSNVTGETGHEFKDISYLGEGYNRYLNVTNGKGISYLSCKWIPQ